MLLSYVLFFFKQKTAYEMRISDWSSDVCSSDLAAGKFIDDHDLAVLDDIVGVDAKHLDRLQRLIDVMDDPRVLDVIEVVALQQARILEQPLDMLGAVLGQVDRLRLFVLLDRTSVLWGQSCTGRVVLGGRLSIKK